MRIIMIFLLVFSFNALSSREARCRWDRWNLVEGGRFEEANLFVTNDEFFELWKRAKSGDPDAEKEFVKNATFLTSRLIWRWLGNHHDVEDAIQETVFAAISKINPSTADQLIVMVMGVARRKCIDVIRKRQKRRTRFPLVSDLYEEDFPDPGVMDGDLLLVAEAGGNSTQVAEALHKEMRLLLIGQPKVLGVYDAVMVEGLTPKEAAERLGLRVDTVYGYITRIRYTMKPHEARFLELAD